MIPFEKGTGRDSTMLSLFRFLRGNYSPLRLFIEKPNLDWISTYLCVASVALLFAFHVTHKFDSLYSSLLAMTLLVAFYKVGNHQFYITLFLLQVFTIAHNYRAIVFSECRLTSTFIFIVWIALASILFVVSNEYRQANLKELIGLPTFVLSLWMIVDMSRNAFLLADNGNSHLGVVQG